MIEDVTTQLKQIIEYCEEGDYMTALSYFDSVVRPTLENTNKEDYPEDQQHIYQFAYEQRDLIDDEQWQQVIYNIDQISQVLNNE